MVRGRAPKALLLVALAWMAWSLNGVAIQGVYSTHNVGWVDPRASLPTGLHQESSMVTPEVYGWSAHPLAAIILIALAILFLLDVKLGPTWMRRRYWIALAALVVGVLPPDQIAVLAIPAFVLVLIAALLNKPAAVVAAP